MRHDNIKEKLKVVYMVWTCENMRPRLCQKTNTGDGTTSEEKRKTEAEMDGLCQPDMKAIGTTKDEVHDLTDWRIIVSAATERLEEEESIMPYYSCYHLSE